MTKPCPKCLGTGRVVDQIRLGRTIQNARCGQGWNLLDFAGALGISPQYLYDLEHGKRNWSLKLKAKADKILKV